MRGVAETSWGALSTVGPTQCPDNDCTRMIWLLIVGGYVYGVVPTEPVHSLGRWEM